MPAGLNTLQKAQAGLETVRGTGIAATRIVYFDRGAWFEELIGRDFPDEDRNSFIQNYRNLTVSRGPVAFSALARIDGPGGLQGRADPRTQQAEPAQF